MHLIKLSSYFAMSVLITYTLACLAHTQRVLAGLLQLGVPIPLRDRLMMFAGDWIGLYLYLVVIAVGLLIAFGVMGLLKRFAFVPGAFLFALGGGLAMLCILVSMRELASLTPIAGARGTIGLSLQCLAGVIGGAVFGASLSSLSAVSLSSLSPVKVGSKWSEEIDTLDPAVDYERICFLLSACEFSWDIEKALEFALFRTYAVPSISALLSWTGEFRERTRKRYDDTELLMSEISENGQDSERGQAAINRINDMHRRFRISNDDMLYVLSTFVVEPVKWLERFGKRPMSSIEVEAWVNYYRALAVKMDISHVPENYSAFEHYHRHYESENFQFAESNAEIGSLTRDLLLSMYLPKPLVPFCRPAIHALCDPPLRRAMGFADPPLWLERSLISALRIRAKILRVLPSRRKPRLITKRRRPTYPLGYEISQLGTFK